MQKETFNEINESLNEGLEIVKGNIKPSRTFTIEPDQKEKLEDTDTETSLKDRPTNR